MSSESEDIFLYEIFLKTKDYGLATGAAFDSAQADDDLI